MLVDIMVFEMDRTENNLKKVPKKYRTLVKNTHQLIAGKDPDPSYSAIQIGITRLSYVHDPEVARRITEDSPILIQALQRSKEERRIMGDCAPRVYQDVQAWGKTNAWNAYDLFQYAALLIHKTGAEGYAKISDYLSGQDDTEREQLKTQVEKCFNLPEYDRFLIQKKKATTHAYPDEIEIPDTQRAERVMQVIHACPDQSADEFLISFIHDQKSAHAVGQVIDNTKYGKEYAQKCGGFY